MNEIIHDVVSVEPLNDYRLRIQFDDGVEGIVDVAQRVSFKGVFAPLRDLTEFRRVKVNPEIGTIAWPNGADLDPVVLYSLVTGHPIGFANSTEK
jgi:hypothetical protein